MATAPLSASNSVQHGKSVAKRLQSELMSLMMSSSGVSAFPADDNIFQWTGTIVGGEGVRALPCDHPRPTGTSPCFAPPTL